MTTVAVTVGVVAAVLVPAVMADTPAEVGHTWRWRCTCGLTSVCTFPSADDADRAAHTHICTGVTS